MPLIEVDNVSKSFRSRGGLRNHLIRDGFFNPMGLVNLLRRRVDTITALHDISFSVEPGEAVGIIGANGSGKSTLLKLLAGVSIPTTGCVNVHGRVASLLELGAGFHPLLTGRENVYLNARILGMNPTQVNRVFDQIVEFSGIEEFLDNPVYTYSSGMFVRLGFAVAVYTDPDVFLVDEVLAVGDEEFQRKCRIRISELREQGKTMVFVSHDLGMVNSLCSRVVLLIKGRMVVRESTKETIDYYLRQIGRDYTLTQGPLMAQFDTGRLRLSYNDKEITSFLHFYGSMLISNLWNDSIDLQWQAAERTDRCIVVSGESRRFPYGQTWEIEMVPEGVAIRITLNVKEPIDVNEYHASLVVRPEYDRWETDHEQGVYPDFVRGLDDWRHANRIYAPGHYARALSSSLPPISLKVTTDEVEFRMTALNTGYHENARVLQALRTPGRGVLHFDKGKHLYFSGLVSVGGMDKPLIHATQGES